MSKKQYKINIVKNKKNGFTLVELLIVMAIIAVLAIIVAGILNPTVLINKGKDSQRKKDLNRIKTAFEEYFNDKGYFPSSDLVASLQDPTNCNSGTVFAPYLAPWPCDPNGGSYKIIVGTNEFRIIANLKYKKDKDIPDGWYLKDDSYRLYDWTIDDVNYGVSSSNILWYDPVVITKDYSMCTTTVCGYKPVDGTGGCKVYDGRGCDGGDNCYFYDGGSCTDRCEVISGYSCPM